MVSGLQTFCGLLWFLGCGMFVGCDCFWAVAVCGLLLIFCGLWLFQVYGCLKAVIASSLRLFLDCWLLVGCGSF